MSELTLLGLSGSLRKASTNRLLMHEAAKRFSPTHFIEANLRLPLYDGDLEEANGIPAEVQTLADQIKTADAVIVVTPEYNKMISGVLKNALDWVSRVPGGVWADKPVAVLSATAGRSGGEQTQATARHALLPFQPRLVVGPDVLVGANYEQWNDAGELTNDRYLAAIDGLMAKLKSEATR
ncbi:MAG: NAD(P)H-dependent oxidoreductase [Pelagimonas sp.]|jgi:chromate reductase|nr:NAD(P)H-dependent oxidoreductase [Pelagimonas sp.]